MKEIFDKYINNYQPSAAYSVEFFNEHAIVFENVKTFHTKEDVTEFVEIYHGCIKALVETHQYNNAINSTKKVFPVIDKALLELGIDRTLFDQYRRTRVCQAIAYVYLKDYATGTRLFSLLSTTYPENDSYKAWVDYCKLAKIKRYNFILLLVSASVVILTVFIKRVLPEEVRLGFSVIGTMSLFAAIGLDVYSGRLRARQNSGK